LRFGSDFCGIIINSSSSSSGKKKKSTKSVNMSAGLFALNAKKGREEKRMKELRDAFDSADKDGDGKLNPAEWLEVLKVTGVEATW
jgi:Ca2+-binding EF-hand superfamily protein